MTDDTKLHTLRVACADHEIVLLDYAWAAKHFELVAQIEESAGVGDRSLPVPFTAATLREALRYIYTHKAGNYTGFGLYGLSREARTLLDMLLYRASAKAKYRGFTPSWLGTDALYISCSESWTMRPEHCGAPADARETFSTLLNYNSRLYNKGGYLVSVSPDKLEFNESNGRLRRPVAGVCAACFNCDVFLYLPYDDDDVHGAQIQFVVAKNDRRSKYAYSFKPAFTIIELRADCDILLAPELPLSSIMCFAVHRPVPL